MPIESKFRFLVLGFLPTETKTTSHSKLIFFPSLLVVETTAPLLFFLLNLLLFVNEN